MLHRCGQTALLIPLRQNGTFIVLSLASAEAEKELCTASGEMDIKWYQRNSLLLDLPANLAEFRGMGKKLSLPIRIVVVSGFSVLGYMCAYHPEFTFIVEGGIRALQAGLAVSYGLDLGSDQYEADFQCLQHMVIVPCTPVSDQYPAVLDHDVLLPG